MKKYFGMIMLALLMLVSTQVYGTVRKHGQELKWLGTSDVESYSGLSTDTKPTTWRGVAISRGASFFETNTGSTWFYDGSAWTLQFGVAASDTMRLTAVGTTPAWCSVGFDKVKFIMKTTGADSTIFLVYGKKNPGGVTVIGDSIRTGGNAEINRDYGYPGLFDSLYVKVARIDGSLAAARIHIVGKKREK